MRVTQIFFFNRVAALSFLMENAKRRRRSADQSEVKALGDAVREIRLGVPAATEKGETDSRFDRDNGDGDRRQEGSLIGRAPIA